MKGKLFALLAIATVATIAISCNNEKEVVALHETAVVDSTLQRDIPMSKFYECNLDGRKAFIEHYKRQLTYNVYDRLYVKGPEDITFLIASGTAKDLQGLNKKICDANFENEIVIICTGSSDADTVLVFNGVRCSVNLTKQTNVGNGEPWKFEINNDKKLKDYLSSIEKWDSINIQTTYTMPGLRKDQRFSDFLKENEKSIYSNDLIDCFDRRVIDQERHDVANFKKRERLKKR